MIPVPWRSTITDTRSAHTTMAYTSWMVDLRARPAAKGFFATSRAAYVAERSTLAGIFPEKTLPPCGDAPLRVSMMILLTVQEPKPRTNGCEPNAASISNPPRGDSVEIIPPVLQEYLGQWCSFSTRQQT